MTTSGDSEAEANAWEAARPVEITAGSGVQVGDCNIQFNSYHIGSCIQAGSRPPGSASGVDLRTTLPPAPHLSGRDRDLGAVLAALAPAPDAPTVVCIAGLPGVGKTGLALRAASHARKEALFRAALFVDLRGYQDVPADPADILAVLLRGLDGDVAAVGPGVDERAAAYRGRLAELASARYPVLIVADDAADPRIVRWIVPPSGPHRLLVTSRDTLATLDGRMIDLPALTDDASAELLADALRRASRHDPRADRDTLGELARLCGGMALALRITASLLIRDPHLTPAELAGELLAESGPLEILNDGEHAVRAAIELSYRRLPAHLAELLCLLVLSPGLDLSTEAAEVLTGLRRPVLRRRLAALASAHLLDGTRVPGRWRMHELIRAFAIERVLDRPSAPDGEHGRAEQQRLLRYYRDRVEAADLWLRGFTPSVGPGVFPSLPSAIAWLDAEHVNVALAVQAAAGTGIPDEAVRLALGLTTYLRTRLLREEALWALGIAAQAAPTQFTRAQMLDNMGTILGSHAAHISEAIPLHEEALRIFREQGRRTEEGIALLSLGYAYRHTGRTREAISCDLKARNIFKQGGPAFYLAGAWINLARAWIDQEKFGIALRAADQGLLAARVAGNSHTEVLALFARFSALFGQEDYGEALTVIRQVVAGAADAMMPPHVLGRFLTESAAALRAAGHPEAERRAALLSAADAFDQGGLSDLGETIREMATRDSTSDPVHHAARDNSAADGGSRTG